MLVVTVGLLIAVCAILLLLLLSSERGRRQQQETVREALQQWIAELKGRYQEIVGEKEGQTTVLQKERDTYKELATKWSERISSIDESLDKISEEATKRVEDMASTLKPIVSIFRSPQAAGIEFGEAELEMFLKTHLGESLYLRKPPQLAVGQEVVDFAIRLPDCLVPIDSKFPAASYKAWVEAASEEEGKAAWRVFRNQMLEWVASIAKYIKPDAGTTDYALLFVPSDTIYQQAFLTQRIYDQENPIPKRSQELQVFGCSTQTLMPYIGLIRLGLRNLKISEDAKEIRSQIDQLSAIFKLFSEDWRTLRGHATNLANHLGKLCEPRGTYSRLGETIRRLESPEQEKGGDVAGGTETPVSHGFFQAGGRNDD
jgi:DNA recombination protein RmuC